MKYWQCFLSENLDIFPLSLPLSSLLSFALVCLKQTLSAPITRTDRNGTTEDFGLGLKIHKARFGLGRVSLLVITDGTISRSDSQ